MKKKLLALLLTLCLVLGLFPIGVLAAPAEPGAVEATKTAAYNAEKDEVTITLSVQGKDVTGTVTEENPVDVVLVVDNSGSMDDNGLPCSSSTFKKHTFGLITWWTCENCGNWYWNAPATCTGEVTYISAAKKSADLLMSELAKNSENRLAVVGFTGGVGGIQDEKWVIPDLWSELNSKSCYSLQELDPQTNEKGVQGLTQAIADMSAVLAAGTNYTAGLAKAQSYLEPKNNPREKYVIFISDGTPGLNDSSVMDYPSKTDWNGTVQAAALKGNGVQIYTIGLGLGDKTEYLYRLASKGKGYTYNLDSEQQINEELPALIEKIATKISTVTKPAATKLTFTDEISKDFTWVEGQELPQGVTYNKDNHTVTWTFAETTGENQTVSFKVKPNAPTVCGEVKTNGAAKLTYTKHDNTNGEIDVSSATVTLGSYKLTYDLNGGAAPEDCENAFAEIAIRQNAAYTLPTCEPTREDYTFAGWKDANGNLYKAGATITMNSAVTLTAQWEPTTKQITLNFYDVVNGKQVKEEKMTVAKDATTVNTSNITLPAGYEFTETGDLPIRDNNVYVEVKPVEVSNTVIVNIRFMDGDEFIAGGDFFFEKDASVKFGDLELPEGYELDSEKNNAESGFVARDGAQIIVHVKKISTTGIMNIRFMDGETFVAGGDYFLPLGVQNYAVLAEYVPEGYRMCVAGDFMVTDGGKLDVPVEKIPTTGIMNIRFVEESTDKFIAGGDYMLPLGVQNYSILNEYVPEGYQMCVSGDFMVTAGGKLDVPVEKIKAAAYTVTLVNEGRNAYGEGSYKAGETVTIYAGIKAGYSFDKWTSGDIAIARPYASKLTFTMPAHNVVVKATWDRAGSILPSLPGISDDTTPNWLNLDDHDAYVQGYPDGRVKPQNNITRAEVATIFYRLLTDDARDYYYSTDSGFSDVKPGDWYNTAVSTMVQAGILNGYSDGTFKPNASITRAEFATIAARFLSNPYSLKDRFTDTEGHWAEVYINRAAEVGWINGYTDGSFKPDQAITRAEAVTLVNNVLGRAPHADYMLDDMVTWPDNPKSAWFYEDIQEATNSHDYRWNSGKRYEIWTSLN